MTATKSLPARPSLDSLRKQAKQLSREVLNGNLDAIVRVLAQIPAARMPLSRRDAQLVLAREYGYVGWQDLTAEVLERLGRGLEWAGTQAKRLIHDNDIEALGRLLTEYPALLTWGADAGGLLGFATSSYGDSYDPERERQFTRRECAELLIEAGAVVVPSVCEGLVHSRAREMLQLFRAKDLLPQKLKFFVALEDLSRVRACFDADGKLVSEIGESALQAVNEAFTIACRFKHEAIASFLLERYIALDPRVGERIEAGPGPLELVKYLLEEQALDFIPVAPADPWQTFVMHKVVRAIHEDDLRSFGGLLQGESWLLEEPCRAFQVGLLERAVLRDRPAFIERLLDLAPALIQHRPPPPSQAIEFALVYGRAHLIPILMRIWPLPDDLPHAAGVGDLAGVKRWFDDTDSKRPAEAQPVVDTAFAWAVLNRHLEVAEFLLAHGADINTRWGSHEPASVLHELVLRGDHDGMRFLIERGIDMTIVDYRWGATAEGWARHAANNPELGEWLAEAQRRRRREV